MRPTLEVELTRVVEPAHAVRASIDDERLNSLVVSIRKMGVIEPLVVKVLPDESFEVLAGHRRLLAARIAGLVQVPVLVCENPEEWEAIKIHENLEREDLNPAEEGVFYAELYEKLGQDTEAVAATVRKSREHVEARLNLLRSDSAVLEALRAGKISLGVAQELNRMELERDRGFHLDYCLRTGASVRVVREWRTQANQRAELAAKTAAPPTAGENAEPVPGGAPPLGPKYVGMAKPWELSTSTELRPCMMCGEEHQEWQMYRKFFCTPCADRHLTRIEAEVSR